MACTTILVGKNASYDGSTIVARNEDSPSTEFMPKKFIVVKPKDQPKKYKSVISHAEIALPKNPLQYTCMPNGVDYEGIWGCCGVNALNISMSATETITSNERVLAADPLVNLIKAKGKKGTKGYLPETPGGIGEEDFVTLVLPYIRSAREGVIRLGSLLEQVGTYEMNGIAFQDENEIWWLETIGGHHWIAKRVPDDSYVIMPNQFGIDYFDLKDAFGEQREHLCSADLREFIAENHLDLSLDEPFNARYAFGSNADSDHTYNTPRAWIAQRYLNPKSSTWDGIDAEYRPDSDDIPWMRVPDRKITIEDVKYILSLRYQGTPYDPYGSKGDPSLRGAFRPIGLNRNNTLACVQIRPYMPEDIKSIQWIAYGSNVFNALVPFYVNVDKTPKYVANTTDQVSTENFYWANRLVAVMADASYNACSSHIERYQLAVQTKGRAIVNKYDKQFEAKGNTKQHCEAANAEIADMIRKETDDLLDKVLFTSSMQMKSNFARSDA